MAGGIDWFRWHHGSVVDPKFQLVAKRAGVTLPAVLAVWAYTLEKASASDDRGEFGEIDVESLDCLFGFDDGATDRILAALHDRGLIESGRVVSWEKRQPKRERDGGDPTAADRKRAQRERDAESSAAVTPDCANVGSVTPCHAMSRQKKPRGEERRVEIKEKQSQGLSPNQEQRAEVTRTPEKRASRFALRQLPEDWAVFCTTERPDLDPGTTFQRFSDYWQSKAGKDGRKLDWTATWRNWCRSERPPHRSDEAGSIRRLMASIASDPRFHDSRNPHEPS